MKFLKEYKFPIILITIIILFYYLLIVKDVFAYREPSMCRDSAMNINVILNPDTFTKVLDSNPNEIKRVFCTTAEQIWVYLNFRSVGTSLDETGILLTPNRRCHIEMAPVIYTGEVTAIASAGNPKLTVMAY